MHFQTDTSYILQHVVAIEHGGETVGLHAWFLVADARRQPVSFTIEPEVTTAHPQEYLEAVMADVNNFLRFGTLPANQVAVVNRRGIGSLVSRASDRCQ